MYLEYNGNVIHRNSAIWKKRYKKINYDFVFGDFILLTSKELLENDIQSFKKVTLEQVTQIIFHHTILLHIWVEKGIGKVYSNAIRIVASVVWLVTDKFIGKRDIRKGHLNSFTTYTALFKKNKDKNTNSNKNYD